MFYSFVTSAPSILPGTGDIIKSLMNLLIETLEVVEKGDMNSSELGNNFGNINLKNPQINSMFKNKCSIVRLT